MTPPSPRGDGSRPAAGALDEAVVRSWPLPTADDGDKHERGTVLVVGGSTRTPGAVLLAGVAALRMGAGRLQLATAAPAALPLAVAVPEAMVVPWPADGSGECRAGRPPDELAECASSAAAVLIGPGLTDPNGAAAIVRAVLGLVGDDAVVVLDAVALRRLGDVGAEVLDRRRGRLVVTPNQQELTAMRDGLRRPDDAVDDAVDAVDPDGLDDPDDPDALAAAVAAELEAVVVSFGRVTAGDGTVWAAPRGVGALGTSGSGDVLAGLVAGAAARSGDAAQAACWATVVHQSAGVRLGRRMAKLSPIARELLDEVPLVLQDLER